MISSADKEKGFAWLMAGIVLLVPTIVMFAAGQGGWFLMLLIALGCFFYSQKVLRGK